MEIQWAFDAWNNFTMSGDVRGNKLPFIADPTFVICASTLYLVIIKVGPRLMEKRRALEFRRILIGYNFLSVIFSLWMMWEFFVCTFLNPRFNLRFEPFDQTDVSPTTMRLINAHWWYFASKIVEFLDTFFFILRKKNNQISFLHVYHHWSMLLLQWSMLKFIPGGASYFGPLCNSFIHAVMYTYYMLTAVGPHMQKYLWWKRYLTKMQITQFLLIFGYCTSLICLNLKGIFLFFSWLKWTYMITLLILFGNFYIKAYSKEKRIASSSNGFHASNGFVAELPSVKSKEN